MSTDEGSLAIEDEPTSLTLPATSEGMGIPFGRYRLLERIGTGGMAEIYRAVAAGPQGFQRVVAIKRIRDTGPQLADIGRLFADEARVSALLDHPNIVQVYDYGAVDGTHYIAMEHLSGRNLDEVLRGLRALGERLSPALAVFIAREVAQGLAYAHSFCDERGRPLEIVHRDVTPANIMLVQAGAVKLLDFGIARVTSELRLTITRGRVIKGKCPYMAPEQITGAKIDGRCDIFALGCVLWEMLTNQRLFQGETELDMMSNVLNSDIPPPSMMAPGVPPVLDLIAQRALARDPSARYASADLLAADLEALMRTLPSRHGDLTALLTRLYGRVTPAGLRPVVVEPQDTVHDYDLGEVDTRSLRQGEQPAVVVARPPLPRPATAPRVDDDATTRLIDHGTVARMLGEARTFPTVHGLLGSPRAPAALAVTGAMALAAAILVALVPIGAGVAAGEPGLLAARLGPGGARVARPAPKPAEPAVVVALAPGVVCHPAAAPETPVPPSSEVPAAPAQRRAPEITALAAPEAAPGLPRVAVPPVTIVGFRSTGSTAVERARQAAAAAARPRAQAHGKQVIPSALRVAGATVRQTGPRPVKGARTAAQVRAYKALVKPAAARPRHKLALQDPRERKARAAPAAAPRAAAAAPPSPSRVATDLHVNPFAE